jgi:hypothetical protein
VLIVPIVVVRSNSTKEKKESGTDKTFEKRFHQ